MQRLLLRFTTWEWLLLLLMIPLLAFSIERAFVLFLALPIFWLLRKVSTGHLVPPTPYNLTLLLFALAIILGIVISMLSQPSLTKIAGLALGISLFFAAVEHCRQSSSGLWHVLAGVLVAGSAISSAALFFTDWTGIGQALNQLRGLLPQAYLRLPGTAAGMINPNELAGVLCWIVPLNLAIAVGHGPKLLRSRSPLRLLLLVFLLLSLALNSIVLLASNSRGGILAVAAALLLMLAIEFGWGRVILAAGLLAGGVLLIIQGSEPLFSDTSATIEAIGLEARLEIWSRGLYALSDFPLTGVGLNGFRHIVHTMYPLFQISPATDIGHAHNHLLQAGLDFGIPGLIAYLAIWLLSFGLLWQALFRDKPAERDERALRIGLSGSLAAGWVFGILDAIALGARPGFIWWLLLALLVATTVRPRPPA